MKGFVSSYRNLRTLLFTIHPYYRAPYPKRPGCYFFVVAPFCSCPASLVSRNFFAVGPGCAKCFFCYAPLGAATFFGGARAKKTPRVCFFAPAPGKGRGRRSPVFFLLRPGLLLPLPFPGAGAKKTLWVVFFFFAAAPRGRSLTHCGPGWRCLPLDGVVFFFCCGPARTGVVFFCCGPARTLTHSLWAGAISAWPGWCFFFAAAPPGLFRQ